MKPLIIGVAGGSGSGKTTVARAIDEAVGFDSVLVDMDAYYQPFAELTLDERKKINFDHPDAFDLDLLVRHVDELAAGRAIEKPRYDYPAYARARDTTRVEPRDVIIIEGILLFVDARLRDLCDIRVFVDVADDIRFIRRLQRDVVERGRSVDDVIKQYLNTVRPMHLEFVEPSKRYAHVILPEGGLNRIGVEMLMAQAEVEAARRRGGAGR